MRKNDYATRREPGLGKKERKGIDTGDLDISHAFGSMGSATVYTRGLIPSTLAGRDGQAPSIENCALCHRIRIHVLDSGSLRLKANYNLLSDRLVVVHRSRRYARCTNKTQSSRRSTWVRGLSFHGLTPCFAMSNLANARAHALSQSDVLVCHDSCSRAS